MTAQSMPAMTSAVGTNGWADRINLAWRKSAAQIIETGQLLRQAKQVVDKGGFQKMVESQLDFDASVARKLMAIAGDERIIRACKMARLPKHWTTLYGLHKLSDDALQTALSGDAPPKGEDVAKARSARPTVIDVQHEDISESPAEPPRAEDAVPEPEPAPELDLDEVFPKTAIISLNEPKPTAPAPTSLAARLEHHIASGLELPELTAEIASTAHGTLDLTPEARGSFIERLGTHIARLAGEITVRRGLKAAIEAHAPKRGRGRPLGAKNKKPQPVDRTPPEAAGEVVPDVRNSAEVEGPF
jgi:hypothetical protein